MADGALLATGCGIFFIFLAGVYMYLRSEVLPRHPEVSELPDTRTTSAANKGAA